MAIVRATNLKHAVQALVSVAGSIAAHGQASVSAIEVVKALLKAATEGSALWAPSGSPGVVRLSSLIFSHGANTEDIQVRRSRSPNRLEIPAHIADQIRAVAAIGDPAAERALLIAFVWPHRSEAHDKAKRDLMAYIVSTEDRARATADLHRALQLAGVDSEDIASDSRPKIRKDPFEVSYVTGAVRGGSHTVHTIVTDVPGLRRIEFTGGRLAKSEAIEQALRAKPEDWRPIARNLTATWQVGGHTQHVGSMEDAARIWDIYREQSGRRGEGGVSHIGNGLTVRDADGTVVGTVSYNGRIWRGAPGSPEEAAEKAAVHAELADLSAGKEKTMKDHPPKFVPHLPECGIADPRYPGGYRCHTACPHYQDPPGHEERIAEMSRREEGEMGARLRQGMAAEERAAEASPFGEIAREYGKEIPPKPSYDPRGGPFGPLGREGAFDAADKDSADAFRTEARADHRTAALSNEVAGNRATEIGRGDLQRYYMAMTDLHRHIAGDKPLPHHSPTPSARQFIGAKIAQLEREGYPRLKSIRIAFEEARRAGYRSVPPAPTKGKRR